MRILVLCDDIWHPAQVVKDGLAGLEKDGFEFDFIADACEWSAKKMAAYSVVILSKANNVSAADETPWMTTEIEQAFQDYIRAGNGLLVLHSGTAGYEKATVLRGLMGGVFREHPEQCAVMISPAIGALSAQRADTIPAPTDEFSVVDEHYLMDMDDDHVEVFMTTTSKHGTQPGGWTRTEGDGRVCVLTPGHNLAVWEQPVYQDLIRQAIDWCANR
jgi:uncharacterized protein